MRATLFGPPLLLGPLPCMASQPAVESSTAEDQPASLQAVLSTLQTLTTSLGQLATTSQQTQTSVAHYLPTYRY
eukprot:SAG31_NODE_4285_length_3381_cov_1.637112_6_plen_74_part_00